jgi:hypothetical protein
MISLYVGITDYEWFRFLSASFSIASIGEVNFWQPGGRTNFRAVRAGNYFHFKLRAPRNFIVGGGVFAREILPTSIAWDAFLVGPRADSNPGVVVPAYPTRAHIRHGRGRWAAPVGVDHGSSRDPPRRANCSSASGRTGTNPPPPWSRRVSDRRDGRVPAALRGNR